MFNIYSKVRRATLFCVEAVKSTGLSKNVKRVALALPIHTDNGASPSKVSVLPAASFFSKTTLPDLSLACIQLDSAHTTVTFFDMMLGTFPLASTLAGTSNLTTDLGSARTATGVAEFESADAKFALG